MVQTVDFLYFSGFLNYLVVLKHNNPYKLREDWKNMYKYYKISEKVKDVKHGLIIRLSSFDNNLKCVAGEDFDKDKCPLLPKLNITIENSRIAKINNHYSFSEITEADANVLIHDWNHFLECVMEGEYNPPTPWRDI